MVTIEKVRADRWTFWDTLRSVGLCAVVFVVYLCIGDEHLDHTL